MLLSAPISISAPIPVFAFTSVSAPAFFVLSSSPELIHIPTLVSFFFSNLLFTNYYT